MSSQSAAQFYRRGAQQARAARDRKRGQLPQVTLEYFRDRARRRRGQHLRYPAHTFVDSMLRVRDEIAQNVFMARVLCDGEVHQLRARPGGAIHFANHSRTELRALRVLGELTGKPCGCLVYAAKITKAKAKKSFQPVLDEARLREDARQYTGPHAFRGDALVAYRPNVQSAVELQALLRAKWWARVQAAVRSFVFRIGERYGADLVPQLVAGAGPDIVFDARQKQITFRFDWSWCRLLIAGNAFLGEHLVLSFDVGPGGKFARARVLELVVQRGQVPAKVEVVRRERTADEKGKAPQAPAETVQVTKQRTADVLAGVRVVERMVKWAPADQFSPAGWRVIQ